MEEGFSVLFKKKGGKILMPPHIPEHGRDAVFGEKGGKSGYPYDT